MVPKGEYTWLRKLCADDIDVIVNWDTDEELAKLTGLTSKDAGDGEMQNKLKRNRNCVYMGIVDENGKLIGDVQLKDISWRLGECELVIRIGDKSCWGMGYGTKVIRELFEIAFFRLSLKKIYLRVESTNERAINCYKKCGFKSEGTIQRVDNESESEEKITLILMSFTKAMYEKRYPMVG